MIASTSTAVAQSSATGTGETNAKVITPITITKTGDMNFGNLVATAAGGDIVLPTTAVRTGDAAILAGPSGTVTSAVFSVGGEAEFTYAITLPSGSFDVSNSDETPATMSVGTFVTSTGATGTLAPDGTDTLKVGATITLAANQASGTYTNANALAITVNYN